METKVIELISEHFGVPVAEIAPTMLLRKDLNATDLEIADFFQTIEQTFTVPISTEDAQRLETIGDLISYIEDHAEDTT